MNMANNFATQFEFKLETTNHFYSFDVKPFKHTSLIPSITMSDKNMDRVASFEYTQRNTTMETFSSAIDKIIEKTPSDTIKTLEILYKGTDKNNNGEELKKEDYLTKENIEKELRSKGQGDVKVTDNIKDLIEEA